MLYVNGVLTLESSRLPTCNLFSWSSERTFAKLGIQHVEGIAVFFNAAQLLNNIVKQSFLFNLLINEPFQEIHRCMFTFIQSDVSQIVEFFVFCCS